MKPTLEISMIVKNGGAGLARCLQSAVSVADRILVGDTGSTDDSIEIARTFGAEVLTIPWEADFARARNRLLDHRRCDWILILDHDEMLDHEAGDKIRRTLENADCAAYNFRRWNYVKDRSARFGFQMARPNPFRVEASRLFPAYVELPSIRLFCSHAEIRWEGRVHESLLPSLDRLGLEAGYADVILHHFGHAEDTESERQQKNDLYHVLGERKLREQEDDPQALFEMGLSELDNAKRPAAALERFERACVLRPEMETAWLFAAICLIRLSRLPEAAERLDRAAALGLRNGLFFQSLGDLYYHSGGYAEACKAYGEVQRLGEDSPLTEAKHGAAEVQLGHGAEGLARIRSAVEADAENGELLDILAAAALMSGDAALAADALQRRQPLGNITEFHTQLAALVAAEIRQRQS